MLIVTQSINVNNNYAPRPNSHRHITTRSLLEKVKIIDYVTPKIKNTSTINHRRKNNSIAIVVFQWSMIQGLRNYLQFCLLYRHKTNFLRLPQHFFFLLSPYPHPNPLILNELMNIALLPILILCIIPILQNHQSFSYLIL